ncbi:MAG: hypothetical protein ACTSRI_21530 [Promethearchaeota archaeon]
MPKNQTDFMLEEYKQIAKAFSDLYLEKDKILKIYLVLISIGSTFIGTLLTLSSTNEPNPGKYAVDPIAGFLFVILSIVGILILISVIGVRIEMLFYARTINCIRRYFSDTFGGIKDYLVLPIIDDKKPPFREKINRPFIWEVFMISSLNSILMTAGINLLVTKEPIWQIIFVIILTIVQIGIFCLICCSREKEYSPKFSK